MEGFPAEKLQRHFWFDGKWFNGKCYNGKITAAFSTQSFHQGRLGGLANWFFVDGGRRCDGATVLFLNPRSLGPLNDLKGSLRVSSI